MVVLPLVDLARLDPRHAAPSPVDGDADLAQHAPVLAVEDLRPEHHDRTVPARRPQQSFQRLRLWFAVVVQQPDPLDPLQVRVCSGRAPGAAVPQRDRHGLAVAGGPVHAEHRVLPDQLGEHRAAAVAAPCVHPYDALDLVGLGLYRLDEARQQASTVMRDDNRGNGMPGLRRGRRGS